MFTNNYAGGFGEVPSSGTGVPPPLHCTPRGRHGIPLATTLAAPGRSYPRFRCRVVPTFTVLNDIRLKPSYEGVVEAVTLPPETDAAIVAGDPLDRADPASVERGRRLPSRLDDSPVPTALVPGNHDPLATAEALVDGFDSVVLAHERRPTAVDVPGPAEAFGRVPVVGIGRERFDVGVGVESDGFGFGFLAPDRLPGQ